MLKCCLGNEEMICCLENSKIEFVVWKNESLICHQFTHHGSWNTFDKTDLDYRLFSVAHLWKVRDVSRCSCSNFWKLLGNIEIQNKKCSMETGDKKEEKWESFQLLRSSANVEILPFWCPVKPNPLNITQGVFVWSLGCAWNHLDPPVFTQTSVRPLLHTRPIFQFVGNFCVFSAPIGPFWGRMLSPVRAAWQASRSP